MSIALIAVVVWVAYEGVNRLFEPAEIPGLPLLVTYHPAYLLRNPEDKRKTWDDIKFLLADMGVRRGDFDRIEALLDAMLAHQEPSGRFPSYGVVPGGSEPVWGSLLCDSHPILEVLVRFGRGEDPRVRSGLARMAAEHVEQDRLQRMVRAGGIAGRRADALIFLADQLLVGQRLVGRIAPKVGPDVLMEPLRERLGEAVGQRLQEDVGIDVIVRLESGKMLVDAVDADREPADPVLALRRDEIGEAHVRPALTLLHLLTQHRQPHLFVAGGDEDVVAGQARGLLDARGVVRFEGTWMLEENSASR